MLLLLLLLLVLFLLLLTLNDGSVLFLILEDFVGCSCKYKMFYVIVYEEIFAFFIKCCGV